MVPSVHHSIFLQYCSCVTYVYTIRACNAERMSSYTYTYMQERRLFKLFFSFRYLHIQLEKDNPNYEPNYDDALSYIAQLPFEAVGQLKVTATYRTGGGGGGTPGSPLPKRRSLKIKASMQHKFLRAAVLFLA